MKTCCAFAVLFAIQAVSAATLTKQGFLQQKSRSTRFKEFLTKSVELVEVDVAPVIWSGESRFPRVVQLALASAWILMLASVPFIIPYLDGKQVTRTRLIVGGSMLLVLFGGLYLFTNIILFQSVHFKEIRPLTVVECIYFMSQVITTVGYGDVTPARPRGQLFIALYVLGSIFLIANLISDLTNHIVDLAHQYRRKRMTDAELATATPRTTICKLIRPEQPSTTQLKISLTIFAALDICWILFFYLYPGEGKTLLQAIYMSIITLSTVGFGAFTPVTEAGMIFSAFWMLFGSAALVNVITCFTELAVASHKYEQFCQESFQEAVTSLKSFTLGGNEVTEIEFLKFALLHKRSAAKSDLDVISQAFEALSPENGCVSVKSIEEVISKIGVR